MQNQVHAVVYAEVVWRLLQWFIVGWIRKAGISSAGNIQRFGKKKKAQGRRMNQPHLMMAAPQLNPAPKPDIAMISPFFTRPSRTACSSARGMDAAEVFPKSSRFWMILSSGSFSFLATVSIMRMLAWCSSRWSTWSMVMPAFSRASLMTTGTWVVANLYISLPVMYNLSYLAEVTTWPASLGSVSASPLYRRVRCSLEAPSECSANPRMPASSSPSEAVSTAAPAPSPKRMHVLRSSQSVHRDRASAPMTSAFL
mmetsp:Transcript_5204/g.8357  ORF Transcript_5204/g.8357 Transcript_5204/m.8357 type:complete len:255 (-) Transcript_5204:764-1528(-)